MTAEPVCVEVVGTGTMGQFIREWMTTPPPPGAWYQVVDCTWDCPLLAPPIQRIHSFNRVERADEGQPAPAMPDAPWPAARVKCFNCGNEWDEADGVEAVTCTCAPEDERWGLVP